MRSAYIVSYDIADPKRLKKVYKTMYGFGDHIQLSVFRCELSPAEKVRMLAKLNKLIHHDQDQILIIDLGPARGRAENCIDAIGKPYKPQERLAVVV
mgnify:CR=1 FL=1